MITDNQAARTQRYRGVSFAKPITAAKESVSCIDLANRLAGPGGLRKVSGHWTGRCVLPDHEDKTPSFCVYPETNSWFCFGCLRGGDCVELARLVWGFAEREAHTAAGYLLLEFGHEPPQRPPAYFRKLERQQKAREAAEEVRKNVLSRRLFRYLILPLINTIQDEKERDAELERAWSEFRRLMR